MGGGGGHWPGMLWILGWVRTVLHPTQPLRTQLRAPVGQYFPNLDTQGLKTQIPELHPRFLIHRVCGECVFLRVPRGC